MNKIIKKLIPIFAIVLIALSLTACSLTYAPEGSDVDSAFSDIGERTQIDFSDTDSNMSETNTVESEERELIKYADEDVDESDVSSTITVIEGEIIDLQPKAVDPDNDVVTYSFTGPFNDAGLWHTVDGDEGRYLVTVSATDGELISKQYVLIVVNPRNKEPVIECSEEITVFESESIIIDCNIYDREDDTFSVVYSGWMNSDKYVANYEDAGSYTVQVTAIDENNNTASKEMKIYVKDKNRLPIVESIADINAIETDVIVLDVIARDPDGDDLEIIYFDPFDDDGVWRTENGDNGEHEAFVKVSDGTDTVTERFKVIVENINTPPVLQPIPMIVVDEGNVVNIDVDASDPEDDELTIIFSGWMTENNYMTSHDDEGTHYVDVIVSDGRLETTQTVKIVVNNVNRPPVFVVPV